MTYDEIKQLISERRQLRGLLNRLYTAKLRAEQSNMDSASEAIGELVLTPLNLDRAAKPNFGALVDLVTNLANATWPLSDYVNPQLVIDRDWDAARWPASVRERITALTAPLDHLVAAEESA